MLNNDLPYERYRKFGIENLSETDLLALVLRSGTKDKNVYEMSDELYSLDPFIKHGMSGLLYIDENDIKSVKGIGDIKCCQIMCISEISKRIQASKVFERLSFNKPSVIADYYMERFRSLDRENVLVVYLDSKLRLIKDEILTVGTINTSIVSPREVFVRAFRNNAVSIMLMHNHPSGDPEPSKNDFDVTRRIRESGNLVDIPLIDHIIIGDRKYYSMKEHGLI